MEMMPRDIAELADDAEVTRDASGCLGSLARLLEACGPSLLLVADASGNLVAADDLASGTSLDAAGPLAQEMSQGLVVVETCRWELSIGGVPRLAFAVRLAPVAGRGILGGLVRPGAASEKQLDRLQAALALCGAMAWIALAAGANDLKLRKRIEQLLAGQETFRESHGEAVSAAIEERERRLCEQQEHTARIQAVMHAAADAIIIVDQRGVIETFNEAAERIFGYGAEEVVGQNVALLIPPHLRERHAEHLARYQQQDVLSPLGFRREVLGYRKDGSTVPLDLAVSMVFVGDRLLFTGIAHDISERKQREEEVARYRAHLEELVDERTAELAQANQTLADLCRAAEAANHAKTAFLANMSHELRTPLHGILSFATFGIKETRKAGADKLANYFQKIEHGGKVLLTLINDLLDLAKLESGKGRFEFGRVDLRVLICAAVDECAARAMQRNITVRPLECAFPAGALADHTKIMQVLRNLLDNAIKFSPEGGTIEIELSRSERSVLVSVCDRGIGIPENELEAIFDKFIQSSKTRTAAGGTGLGLAICREIVTAHKGRIWAENRPDGGAILTFEIPFNLHEVNLLDEEESAATGLPLTAPAPLESTATVLSP